MWRGASVVQERSRPPRPCGGGLRDSKAKEHLAHAAVASVVPKRRRPPAHAAGAWLIAKQRRPPRQCGGDLGGPKAKEAPLPMQREPG